MPPTDLPLLTVSALTESIRTVLTTHIGAVQVQGEISNLRRQPSGHIYFTLKDAAAQLAAVMFRGDAFGLNFSPRDGDQVIARGEITVYAPRGNYQLRVTSLRPHGRGSLQEQFEAIKRRLQSEGLFDSTRKRPLPVFPRRVAVITSPAGAAVRDFLNILTRRCPHIAITIYGVRVQGEGAHREIIQALQAATAAERYDVIVITRGGGSLEDLWEFNQEPLARAIAACPVPVISGVGHEIDFTICDLVADLRAPTPSAAAELLCRPDAEWRQQLLTLQKNLHRSARDQILTARRRLQTCRDHYVFREPVHIIRQHQQRLDEWSDTLRLHLTARHRHCAQRLRAIAQLLQAHHPARHLQQLRDKLNALNQRLHLLSPQSTLARGYALVQDHQGRLLRLTSEARQAQSFHIRFQDGSIPARINPPSP